MEKFCLKSWLGYFIFRGNVGGGAKIWRVERNFLFFVETLTCNLAHHKTSSQFLILHIIKVSIQTGFRREFLEKCQKK